MTLKRRDFSQVCRHWCRGRCCRGLYSRDCGRRRHPSNPRDSRFLQGEAPGRPRGLVRGINTALAVHKAVPDAEIVLIDKAPYFVSLSRHDRVSLRNGFSRQDHPGVHLASGQGVQDGPAEILAVDRAGSAWSPPLGRSPTTRCWWQRAFVWRTRMFRGSWTSPRRTFACTTRGRR